MTQEPLAARGVSRHYGGRAVVDRVDLTLAPGRITALIGGSGAGKSTLLRLFAGLEPVDAGTITLAGEAVSAPGRLVPAERRHVGLIFQDFALFPHLTALDNISFGLKALPRIDRHRRAIDWLARFNLADRAGAYPHELSGGEQQRVAIARALATAPRAILMDEPFSGLDPALRREVAATALATLREAGQPVLLVTHDAEHALETADWLAVMRAGRIVQQGAPRHVYECPADLEIARALGPVNAFNAAEAPPGLLDAIDRSGGPLIVAREEAVRLDPYGPVRARVTRLAFLGALTRVSLDTGKLALSALVPSRSAPQPDSETGLGLDPALVRTFPADED